jgi:hypothetical protein
VAAKTTDVVAEATYVAGETTDVAAEATTHMTAAAAHMAPAPAAAAASRLCVGRKQAAGQHSARQDYHRSPLHNVILSSETYLRSVESAAAS